MGVFILLSAALVSVQTVINTIICCTYTADTSNLSQSGDDSNGREDDGRGGGEMGVKYK